jgi:UDP-N-acetyl-D-glucosamine dehydrogenase
MAVSDLAAKLIQRIHAREARAGVIGLGYVGLPLAVELARAGIRTVGIDVDREKVAAVNAGRPYILDVRESDIARARAAGTLSATTDFSVIAELDSVTVCVPTPLRKTKDPDMSYIVAAVEQIAAHLHRGLLVVLESTTYPGTTEEVVQTMLEATGMRVGRDFFLAFSPERVDPGNPMHRTANVPKVIGGVTPDCGRLASALYGVAIESIVPVSSPRVAEMVKLLENTFRAVNIGLVNELALMCARMNIDVWEVIEAARTKPFGFMPFYPGPGLGGHCIPIDPFYLSWKARQTGFEPRFIELAGHVNASMPHHVVDLVGSALNTRSKPIRGSSVLIAGIAYKRDIDDIRESPALDVMGLLEEKGARVSYTDPYVAELPAAAWAGRKTLESVPFTAAVLSNVDCVVILTDHSSFDWGSVKSHADLIVDTRNATREQSDHVFRLGAPFEARGHQIVCH